MKMGSTDIRSEELRFQGLLDRFLNNRVAESAIRQNSHLDEDSLAAFVEGNLSDRESKPIVSHLVDCRFCLHVTSDLVRLDNAFADEPAHLATPDAPPSRVSEVLNGLLARIFGTGEGAVFAHHERDEDSDEDNPENKKS